MCVRKGGGSSFRCRENVHGFQSFGLLVCSVIHLCIYFFILEENFEFHAMNTFHCCAAL